MIFTLQFPLVKTFALNACRFGKKVNHLSMIRSLSSLHRDYTFI